jgi:BON domain
MAQSRFTKRPTRTSSVLLVALGAVAGLAIGMLIADRVGGVAGLLRHRGRGSRGGPRRDDERDDEAVDEVADDDSERAGESIAHVSVRRRGAKQDASEVAMPDRRSTRDRQSTRDGRTRSLEPEVAVAPIAAGDGAGPAVANSAESPMGPSVPTHEALEARVLEAFRNDLVLDARAIDIGAVGAGTIELTGWVERTGEIAHALTLARGVPGVTAVVDHLAVRGPGAIRSDRTAPDETPHRP